MHQVLIVEDEQEIRSGLARHRIWHDLGFGQVLEADDGLSAIAIIRSHPGIRLVVTDIKMKKLSGLAFIGRLRDEFSFDGKVIIISGYDDFAYARKAMQYGVVDFLLKPVDISELKSVVVRALSALEKEDRQRYNLSIIEKKLPDLREQWLQERLEDSMLDEAEPLTRRQLHEFGLGWLGRERLTMMAVKADNLKAHVQQGRSLREKDRISFAVGNVLEHSLLEHSEELTNFVLFRGPVEEHWIVIFGENRLPDFRAWLSDFKASLHDRMKRYVKVSVSIAVCAEGSFRSLNAMYDEAMSGLTHINIYGDAESAGEDERDDAMTLRDCDILMEPKALVELLQHGEERDVREAMAHFPAMIREWGIERLHDLHHRIFEWLLAVFEEAGRVGWKREEWRKNPLRLWESIEAFDTMEALLPQMLDYLLQVNEELHGSSHNQIVLKATRYIQEHYAEPITVQNVADHVYLTPEWFGTLFKKSSGMTFLEYVTRLRMEQAKELLQDVSLKIYQIGSLVGYRDAVYFSRLFKKHYGLTPKEYRNSRGIEADE